MDWTFPVFLASLIGTEANVRKLRWGFAVWFVTNLIWCVYDWRIGARWQSVMMLIYAGMAIRGFVRWRK